MKSILVNTLKNTRIIQVVKAYNRAMLSRVVVMAFTDGITSSRKISRLVQENVAYMLSMLGEIHQDIILFSDFKSECAELIIKYYCFNHCLWLKNLEWFTLNTVALDGTTIKANASSNSSVNEKCSKN